MASQSAREAQAKEQPVFHQKSFQMEHPSSDTDEMKKVTTSRTCCVGLLGMHSHLMSVGVQVAILPSCS